MDVLLFGSMGDISAIAMHNLQDHGLCVAHVPFPQNIFRDEAGYRRELVRAVRLYHPKTVMPIGCCVAPARFKEEFGRLFPEVTLCVESPEKVSLLDSKVKSYHWAESIGIALPKTFGSPEEIPPGTKPVFKRDISFGGHGVHFPLDSKALHNLISHQRKAEPYLIEEFVEGVEYSVDAIRYGGRTICSAYRKISSRTLSGPADTRTVMEFPLIERMASRMLDELDFNGLCGFDFMVSDSGQAYLLECNPRFTGGLQTQISSGFEIPILVVRTIGGLQVQSKFAVEHE